MDDSILKELKIDGFAIVRRDGLYVDGIIPDYIDKETFSIMSATIFMGAVSEYNELHLKGPDQIILQSLEKNIVLLPKENKEIYVLIIPVENDISETVKNFLEKIKNK